MAAGQVLVNCVPTTEELTDILTKPLTEKHFVPFRKKLGVTSLHELDDVDEFVDEDPMNDSDSSSPSNKMSPHS